MIRLNECEEKLLVRRAFKKVMRVIKTRNFRKLTNAEFRVSFSFSSDHLLRRVLSFRCIQEIEIILLY